MRIQPRLKVKSYLLLAGFLVGCTMPCAAADDYVVIVNKANPLASISAADLRKMFMGEKNSWPNGTAVTAITPRADAPEYNLAIKRATGMPAADFKRYLIQLSFLGKTVPPPRTLATPAVIAHFVGASPGAISCVPADVAGPEVKTLKVD